MLRKKRSSFGALIVISSDVLALRVGHRGCAELTVRDSTLLAGDGPSTQLVAARLRQARAVGGIFALLPGSCRERHWAKGFRIPCVVTQEWIRGG